jgi:hypothetical protein
LPKKVVYTPWEQRIKEKESMREQYFEAGNLYLATYLLFCGFTMKGLKGDGKLKKILFDNSPDVSKACAEFYADSEARRLFDCYRRAKDYLFQNGV